MMIELTVISLFIILILAYYTLGKNVSSPTILYVGGFWICSCVALFWKEEWGLHKMSPITAYVIIGGAFVFYLVELLYFKQHKPIHQMRMYDMSRANFKPISNTKLILFFFFQLIVYVLVSKTKMDYAMTSSLSDAIVEINDEQKFQNSLVKLPFYINFPFSICGASLSLWCILLSYYLFKPKQYNSQKFWLALNFITTLTGTLLSGGRTTILYGLVSFFVFIYINFQYRKKWKGGLFPAKIMIPIISVAMLFVIFFAELGYAMGRKESQTSEVASLLFAVYCGAEIKNLDDYIQHPFKQGNESDLFAQYTLCGMYGRIVQHSGSEESRPYDPDLAFNDYAGYPLGNVYTTYYNFILDFGYFGALVWTGFMSLIVSFFYRKTIFSDFWKTGRVDLWMVYFGSYMPAACFLSFFANKFFEAFTITGTIKQIIIWWLLLLIFQGKGKLIKAVSNRKQIIQVSNK